MDNLLSGCLVHDDREDSVRDEYGDTLRSVNGGD